MSKSYKLSKVRFNSSQTTDEVLLVTLLQRLPPFFPFLTQAQQEQDALREQLTRCRRRLALILDSSLSSMIALPLLRLTGPPPDQGRALG